MKTQSNRATQTKWKINWIFVFWAQNRHFHLRAYFTSQKQSASPPTPPTRASIFITIAPWKQKLYIHNKVGLVLKSCQKSLMNWAFWSKIPPCSLLTEHAVYDRHRRSPARSFSFPIVRHFEIFYGKPLYIRSQTTVPGSPVPSLETTDSVPPWAGNIIKQTRRRRMRERHLKM